MSEVTDDFLAHYGVRGMKWGKRSGGKSASSGGGSSSKGERKAIRKEIYKDARGLVKANKGKTAVGLLLGGGSITAGVTLARAAGHTKGQALAIGLLGGAPGGVLAVHIAAKRAAEED